MQIISMCLHRGKSVVPLSFEQSNRFSADLKEQQIEGNLWTHTHVRNRVRQVSAYVGIIQTYLIHVQMKAGLAVQPIGE